MLSVTLRLLLTSHVQRPNPRMSNAEYGEKEAKELNKKQPTPQDSVSVRTTALRWSAGDSSLPAALACLIPQHTDYLMP
jgi:hypothetical protein